jgi:hypothetical protein
MVSTSPADHDDLWRKINKMTTLLYPQYSKGRRIRKGGRSFRMPFSQVITASPLVRLRFGEAITGNYSKFNLMRLFGTGEALDGGTTTRTVTESATGTGVSDNREFEAEAIAEATESFTVDDSGFTMVGDDGLPLALQSDVNRFEAREYFLAAVAKARSEAQRRQLDGYQPEDSVVLKRDVLAVKRSNPDGVRAGRPGLGAVVPGTQNDSTAIQTVRLEANTKLKIVGAVNPATPDDSDNRAVRYKVRFANPNVKGVYHVDADSLQLDTSKILNEQLTRFIDTTEGGDGPSSDAALTRALNVDPDRLEAFGAAAQNFFSGENNPIVRSFERTQSAGLAGFVTSLNFDYGESTWETAPGSRAPIWVKVTMNFSPIHDIAPGLDADGANRAPIYSVGHFSNLFAGRPAGGPGGPQAFKGASLPPGDGNSTDLQAENRDAARERAREQAQASANQLAREAAQSQQDAAEAAAAARERAAAEARRQRRLAALNRSAELSELFGDRDEIDRALNQPIEVDVGHDDRDRELAREQWRELLEQQRARREVRERPPELNPAPNILGGG